MLSESGSSIEFDSYTVPEADLEDGQLRLLDVTDRLIVPVNTHIRFIVTSTDVIHDWAVPSLGIKIDATPGRLNQTSALIEREGVFYGQCSEICGLRFIINYIICWNLCFKYYYVPASLPTVMDRHRASLWGSAFKL